MMNEEELQHRVERGGVGKDIDSKAYEVVFDALKKEPNYTLSSKFADRVVEIAAKNRSGSVSTEFIWLGVGVFLLIIAMIVALTKITMPSDFGFLSAMSSYGGLFVFGIFFIGLLQFIDRRFIQQRRTA
jgi:hypothetical protein